MGLHSLHGLDGICRNKTPWCDVLFDRFLGSFKRFRGLLFVRHRDEWADLIVPRGSHDFWSRNISMLQLGANF